MGADKQAIVVPGLFDARQRGFEQCVVAGNLVFIAGQLGVDERFELVSPEFEAQARQVLKNVRLALDAAGATPASITAMTVYYTDIANVRPFSAIRREVLGAEFASTSTAIGVTALALPGALIEITVTAVRDQP
jgi:2-iminobutanoate/2-iminopropanoate deaminase